MMRTEPAMVIGSVATLIVVVVGMFDIAIAPSDVETFLTAGLTLLTSFGIRSQVSPASTLVR